MAIIARLSGSAVKYTRRWRRRSTSSCAEAPARIDLLRALHADVDRVVKFRRIRTALNTDLTAERWTPAGALITYVEVDDAMAVAPTGRYRGFGAPV